MMFACSSSLENWFLGGENVTSVGSQAVLAAETQAKKSQPKKLQPEPDLLAAQFEKDIVPFLSKYCNECHGPKKQEGEIQLQQYRDFPAALKVRDTWEQVIEMLKVKAMPIEGYKYQPSDDERQKVIDWLNAAFFHVDCSQVHDPGRVTIRRLNRSEYNNTIRDLVGVDFEPAKDFPSDDVGYGFDNIGDVLSLPPLLMEKYLDAAETISEAAIVVGDPAVRLAQRLAGKDLKSKQASGPNRNGYRMLSSSGDVFGEFNFPLPGEYLLKVEAVADQAGPDLAKVDIRLNDKSVGVHEITGHLKPGVFETKIKIGPGSPYSTGKLKFSAAFINDYYMPKAKDPKDRDRNIGIKSLVVQGPIGLKDAVYPETHRRILFTKPSSAQSVRQTAHQILKSFAKRAFRRPVVDEELTGFVNLVELAVKQGEDFERGIQLGVQGILVSPHFLFRVETDPEPDNPAVQRNLGQFELASRLSYFLWSSMPDEVLLKLAESGRLTNKNVLDQQVKRMLADERSKTLVENFASQWLNLRSLDDSTPNPKLFPDFNVELRNAMRRETEMLFQTIMREDKSILEFLDANYTFVNERLAKHYGLPNVKGPEFQRVSLKGTNRAGVLTHASILTLTSDPARTSPVKRGKWILENILGTPPPPPPAGVPELAETQKSNPKATLTEQLEIHRQNPVCASCHVVMDPLGLGFENFDAIGRWREKDGKKDIDSAGSLPEGESFKNALELIQILKKREDNFSRHLTRKMLTYALGRGLEYYDTCNVDKITDNLKLKNYRFSALVLEIVNSNPFLKRRGDGGQQ